MAKKRQENHQGDSTRHPADARRQERPMSGRPCAYQPPHRTGTRRRVPVSSERIRGRAAQDKSRYPTALSCGRLRTVESSRAGPAAFSGPGSTRDPMPSTDPQVARLTQPFRLVVPFFRREPAADHSIAMTDCRLHRSASALKTAGVRSRRAIVRAPSSPATNADAVDVARAGERPDALKCAAMILVESAKPLATRSVNSASSAGSSLARFCMRHPYLKSVPTISAAKAAQIFWTNF